MSNKKFTLQFDFEGNINPIKASVEQLQKSLRGVKLPESLGTGLEKTFSRLSSEFDNFQAIVKGGFDDLGNITKAEKSFGKISTLINQLGVQAGQVPGIDPKKLLPQESLDRIKSLEKAWADVRKESEKKSSVAKEIEKQTEEIQEQEKALQKLADQYNKLAAANKTLGTQKGAKTSQKAAAEKERTGIVTKMTALEGQKGGKSSAEYKNLSQAYSELSQKIKGLDGDLRKIDAELNENKVKMAGLTTEINSGNEAYKKMKDQLANLKNISVTPKGLVELRTELAKLTNTNIDEIPQDLEELQKVIEQLTDAELDQISKSLVDIKNNSEQLPNSLEGAKQGMKKLGDAGKEITRAADEVQNLKNQVLQFFSLTNSVQLFKRAITSAMNTVKELDATMTEAAVVTDFDIGDMWEQLPAYSKNAQDLGVSINGMYQATTLYYQQGLKTNEAMQLGIETMKMAKIAGMESTEATQAMTAALRGFNMALNETSAAKVNDVYSQLAAVTAADTNQIATAMEKTASIAASANMEFETTAALLAQIIETTQEAPETAGTAMKTIIARFAEVKSLRDQGLTSGEDEEGELIDVNKIQTALRSVGISMEGFFAGTEGLDSVLLKLSEKWGSLDFETQRYIATMAAGSRQQSRFIAMMSDYKRTTELVGEAQNSAGASQKQFEKTQDSLATSLTRLQNAWDEFLMGLANNEVLKAGVDGLTKILETINKITESLSGGNGLIKSIVSLGGVLATLKMGKTLLGGTAVGGAMSGLISKITGGDEGQAKKQGGYFALPEEANVSGGWSKEGWQQGYNAKRAQMNWSRPSLKGRFTKQGTVRKKDVSAALGKMEMGLDDSDNSAKAMGIRALNEQLADGQITVKEAEEGYLKLGGSIKDLNVDAQGTVPNFDAMGQAANTAGMAMMAAGAATSLLASAFESWGMEEEAEAMQTLSGVLMTLGPILMGIGSFLPVLTGLTAAQAAATWAALWPILLIVAALAALVVAFVLVSKAAHENSLEGRMEAAAEATERAKEAAEGAKQAYDDLLNARAGYDELQNKLDELTKGTLEWKQALADSNAQVLELLDKYPELAKYLTRGKHGELEISEEGWKVVEEQQAQAVKNSQAALISSQMKETRLRQEKAESDLREKALSSGISKVVGYGQSVRIVTDTEDLKAIQEKYAEAGDSLFKLDADGTYSDELEKFAKSIGQTAEEIYNMKDALDDYEVVMAESGVIMQAQAEALLSSAVSEETMTGEFGDALVKGMAAGFAIDQEAKEREVANQLYSKDGASESKTNEYFQQLMKENGLTSADMTGDDAHDLEVLYAKMAGLSSVDDIQDGLKGDKKKLRDEIAKMQAAKEAGEKTDTVYKNLKQLDEKTQQDYSVLLSKNISNATRDFAQQYAAMTEEQANEMLEGLGITHKDLGYETVADMVENYSEIASQAQDAFTKIEKDALRKGVDLNKNYLKNVSSAQLQTFTDLMLYSIEAGGKDALAEGFDKIFEEATDEQDEKITNLLSSFDWTQEGAGEEFLENLKDLSPELYEVAKNSEGFEKALKGVNAVFRDFNIADTLNAVKAGYEEAEEVAGQKYLSHEQFSKYVESGAIEDVNEWRWTGKGWENITNGMDSLVAALKANTLATYNQTVSEAQTKVNWYKEVTDKISGATDSVFVDQNGNYSISSPKFIKGKQPNVIRAYDDNPSLNTLVSSDIESYMASGTAAKAIWQRYFSTEDEYQKWVEAYAKGGMKETEDFLDVMGLFDAENYQIGEEEEKKEAYDKYYNEYEILTSIARKRERLEQNRNKLLEEGNAIEAQKNRQDEINELNKEKAYQDFLASEKRKEFQALREENLSIAQKAGLEIADDGTIKFDVSSVNNMKTADREEFDKLLDKLTELRDQMRDAEDRAFEIDINIKDLEKEDRSSYIDFATQVKDALVSQRKEEIDKLKAIDDSINDTNSQILDSMQRQIDEARQVRDNAKTEQELADKERRLAYLQQDTSGANAAEILKLQKEIEEGQESYTDQLIDQKISELQQQNDEAAEQRARQIEILEAQLEADERNGKFWEDVQKLLTQANTTGLDNSELAKLLQDAAGYSSMSDEEKEAFWEELRTNFGNAYTYKNTDYGAGGSSSGGGSTGDTAGGNTGNTGGNTDGNTGGNSGGSKYSKYTTMGSEELKERLKNLPVPIKEGDTGEGVAIIQAILNHIPYTGDEIEVDGIYGDKTKEKLAEAIAANETMWNDIDGGVFGYYDKELLLDNFPKFKTGGLADFTGPAWLDGTKSNPEYVLNAGQTKAFFTLVDVLSSLKSNSGIAQNIGESSYDIDINVESIGSDYDVERMAEKIKTLIVDATRYRNNNTL